MWGKRRGTASISQTITTTTEKQSDIQEKYKERKLFILKANMEGQLAGADAS